MTGIITKAWEVKLGLCPFYILFHFEESAGRWEDRVVSEAGDQDPPFGLRSQKGCLAPSH